MNMTEGIASREISDESLAEKCRMALEKHYGFQIPLPKKCKSSPYKPLKGEV
jgi:hypothetical protein